LVVVPGSCSLASQSLDALAAMPGATELLGKHMRLAAFSVTPLSGDIYQVSVEVIYGDDDTLQGINGNATDWSKVSCQSGADNDFCATSQLTTEVGKRTSGS
jgi:hypothetical protein